MDSEEDGSLGRRSVQSSQKKAAEAEVLFEAAKHWLDRLASHSIHCLPLFGCQCLAHLVAQFCYDTAADSAVPLTTRHALPVKGAPPAAGGPVEPVTPTTTLVLPPEVQFPPFWADKRVVLRVIRELRCSKGRVTISLCRWRNRRNKSLLAPLMQAAKRLLTRITRIRQNHVRQHANVLLRRLDHRKHLPVVPSLGHDAESRHHLVKRIHSSLRVVA
jgi:hypothetical protein